MLSTSYAENYKEKSGLNGQEKILFDMFIDAISAKLEDGFDDDTLNDFVAIDKYLYDNDSALAKYAEEIVSTSDYPQNHLFNINMVRKINDASSEQVQEEQDKDLDDAESSAAASSSAEMNDEGLPFRAKEKKRPEASSIHPVILNILTNGSKVNYDFQAQAWVVQGFYSYEKAILQEFDGKLLLSLGSSKKTGVVIDSYDDVVEINYQQWLKSRNTLLAYESPESPWLDDFIRLGKIGRTKQLFPALSNNAETNPLAFKKVMRLNPTFISCQTEEMEKFFNGLIYENFTEFSSDEVEEMQMFSAMMAWTLNRVNQTSPIAHGIEKMDAKTLSDLIEKINPESYIEDSTPFVRSIILEYSVDEMKKKKLVEHRNIFKAMIMAKVA